jgi:DNA modification methylase
MARKKPPEPTTLPGTDVVLPPDLVPLLVPIGEVFEDPANPRITKNLAALVAKIRRFGFTDPIGVNAQGMVEAGHQRLYACRELGATHIPRVRLDHTEIEALAYNIAHNRANEEVAAWDRDALVPLLAKLQAEDALEAVGWEGDELAALLGGLEPEGGDDEAESGGDEGGEPDDTPPEPPSDPFCKAGDLILLGDHRVICGDCRDPAVVERLMNGARINVAVTSPPYASQRKYDESSGFKPIAPDDFVGWFDAVQANVRALLADDGSFFVNIKTHSEGLSLSLYVVDLVIAMARTFGWLFASEFCWERNGMPGKPKRRLKNQFEPVYHFAINEWKFRPEHVMHETDDLPSYSIENQWSRGLSDVAGGSGSGWANKQTKGMAYPGNRLPPFGNGNDTAHSASFPIGLPRFFILAYSDHGDTVYDPFMGSGSTMMAAEQTGRRAHGCEISPRYCDAIAIRYMNKTGGTVVVERAGQQLAFPRSDA